MKSFEGKVVVVTGAAQGIGYAIAEKFVQERASKLAILDWNEEAIKAAGEKLQDISADTDVLALRCDISSEEMVNAVFAEIAEKLGTVDVLVNNAGITRDIMFHKMTSKQWDDVLKVNLYGTFNCCKAVMQGMRDQSYGRIVNLSSVVAYGNAGQANYAATKGAIISLTKTLAKEGGRKGITVNAVAPHCIDTPMMHSVPADFKQNLISNHVMQRMGKPEEVAALVVFLANEEASYVSGTCIDCTGGDVT
ncbi:MAG: 3-oxoacyl-ACP reductase FabG [Oscillibacter sp.]|nr:3-oxoacyl-ACP reductase FabG [Oscillibacter sp.]